MVYPKEAYLGQSCLFYINDLPTDIIDKLLLFAGDTKLIKVLLSMMSHSHSELQNDLNHLISWSEKWQLKFNTSKCKVLRFGQSDTKPYTMMNIDIGQKQELKFIDEEKDLGVIVDSKLKFSSHIVNQVKKANRLMGLIRRSYNFLDIVSLKYLFISLIRPHLEYCVTVWYPLLKKDEDLIENVLRRASKMLPRLSNLTYEERLAKIEIPSMKYRRMRGDMIMVYKVLNGYEPSLEHLFAVDNNSITRGHNFKLKKPPFKTTIRQHFFNNRVVNNWNSLPFDVVNATSINSFKNKLDKCWENRMIVA